MEDCQKIYLQFLRAVSVVLMRPTPVRLLSSLRHAVSFGFSHFRESKVVGPVQAREMYCWEVSRVHLRCGMPSCFFVLFWRLSDHSLLQGNLGILSIPDRICLPCVRSAHWAVLVQKHFLWWLSIPEISRNTSQPPLCFALRVYTKHYGKRRTFFIYTYVKYIICASTKTVE